MEKKDSIEELKNIQEHIIFLNQQLKSKKIRKEESEEERKLQLEEKKLERQIEQLERENKDLNSLIDIPESDYIEDLKNQIEINNKDIKTKKEKYNQIKKQNIENKKRNDLRQQKIEKSEEYNKKIIRLKEKIKQFSKIEEFLINGDSWDDALLKLLEWQKSRYKMEEKENKSVIKKDINSIRIDLKIALEIIDIGLLGNKEITEPYNER